MVTRLLVLLVLLPLSAAKFGATGSQAACTAMPAVTCVQMKEAWRGLSVPLVRNPDRHAVSGGQHYHRKIHVPLGATPQLSSSTAISPTFHIVSDTSAKYSENQTPGWETAEFDDSAWAHVVGPSGGLCQPLPGGPFQNSDAISVWGQNPQEYQTIYIRKTFTAQLPLTAKIRTRVDDDFDLYVNGVLVRSDWDGWEDGVHRDVITTLVQNGVNVIALKASDTAGVCQHASFDAAATPLVRLYLPFAVRSQ